VSRIGNRTYPGRYTLGSWRDLEAQDAQNYLDQQVIATDRITVVRCVYKDGSDFPEHFHPQEQITIVEEGTLEFTIAGETIEVRGGQMITINPKIRHATRVAAGGGQVVALNLFLKHPNGQPGFSSRSGIATFLSPSH
jgi:quercetin dioxygenase-like cupin family protein